MRHIRRQTEGEIVQQREGAGAGDGVEARNGLLQVVVHCRMSLSGCRRDCGVGKAGMWSARMIDIGLTVLDTPSCRHTE